MLMKLSALCHAAGTPTARLDEAMRYDLEGKADLAYKAYLEAAQAGVPEAQFNVAVMLDSGRGVSADAIGAAQWYARAAAHGNHRAAYNLGQLYEAGQGVSQNTGLARAWYVASKLPASAARLARIQRRAFEDGSPLSAPTPLVPAPRSEFPLVDGAVELVWTSRAQPEAVQYFVELRAIDNTGSHEIFSDTVSVSSVLARFADNSRHYKWRVTVIGKASSQYITSEWIDFDAN